MQASPHLGNKSGRGRKPTPLPIPDGCFNPDEHYCWITGFGNENRIRLASPGPVYEVLIQKQKTRIR